MSHYLNKITLATCIFLITVLISFSVSFASEIDEQEVHLPESQGACSSDQCSPATPCPSKDEMCYSSNGVFYCCVEPPFPGAEAVGD